MNCSSELGSIIAYSQELYEDECKFKEGGLLLHWLGELERLCESRRPLGDILTS